MSSKPQVTRVFPDSFVLGPRDFVFLAKSNLHSKTELTAYSCAAEFMQDAHRVHADDVEIIHALFMRYDFRLIYVGGIPETQEERNTMFAKICEMNVDFTVHKPEVKPLAIAWLNFNEENKPRTASYMLMLGLGE
jgi:hypothetical protein